MEYSQLSFQAVLLIEKGKKQKTVQNTTLLKHMMNIQSYKYIYEYDYMYDYASTDELEITKKQTKEDL